jgi:hypothetical protein
LRGCEVVVIGGGDGGGDGGGGNVLFGFAVREDKVPGARLSGGL